jgi:hypothetical protein
VVISYAKGLVESPHSRNYASRLLGVITVSEAADMMPPLCFPISPPGNVQVTLRGTIFPQHFEYFHLSLSLFFVGGS